MRRWLYAFLLAGTVALVIGCASTSKEENVSTIPWNRPQSWEGQGAMGGFRPPGSN